MRDSTNDHDAPCEHDHGGNDIYHEHHFKHGTFVHDDPACEHDHYHDAVDHDDLVKRINDDYVNRTDDNGERDDHASYDDAGNVIDHDDIRAAIVDVNNARGTYDYLPAVRTLVDTAAAVLGAAQHGTADRSADTDLWAKRAALRWARIEYDAARDALDAALLADDQPV